MSIQDLAALRQRVALGEDSRTEFKSTARTDDIEARTLGKTIVGLANTLGGWLVLGVEDDGTISGVGDAKSADKLQQKAIQVCRDVVRPPILCAYHKVDLDGKLLLVIDVPPFNPGRPFRSEHRYYVRDGNVTREAEPAELRRSLESVDFHFDEQPVTGTSLADLDLVAARALFEGALGEEDLERHLQRVLTSASCLDLDGAPTVAGILVLGKEPERHFQDSVIKAVRFPGRQISSDEFIDFKTFTGRLPQQLDAAIAFVATHLRSPARIEGMHRVDLGIPDRVVREALFNAVVHRDYRAPAQTTVFVLDDRLEIHNPGSLANSLTLDRIRFGGTSHRRNRTIAALMTRLRKREQLGLGVLTMIEQMRAQGLPEPEFDVSGGFFRVVLRLATSAQSK